jgi:phosphoglycerol transferase
MSSLLDAPALPASAAEEEGRRTAPWKLWLRDLAVVGGAAAVITALLYRVWSWPLRVPFTYRGDSIGLMAFVKIVAETGWYTGTPRAGAPFGMNSYDFPYGGDNGWWLIIKVLTWFTHDAALVLNLLFMLGFVLVAFSAFIGFRVIGAGRLVSGVLALVFAFAPSHFLRTTGQLFIGAPVAVPLACALAMRLLKGDTPLVDATARRLDLRTHLSIFALVSCVILASFDNYYTVFGALVIAAAGLMAAAARRRWRPVVSASLVIVGTAVVALLNSLATLLWRHSHGLNPEVAQRVIEDLDTYALRPVQLLSPVPSHRLSPLAHLSALLTRPGAQSEPYQYLGLVAVVGVAIALVSLIVRAAGRHGPGLSERAGAGALIVVLAAFGITGGLSWLAYTGGLAEVRSWDRVAILIAFFGLVALAPFLESGVRRLRTAGVPQWGVVAIGVLFVGLALFDQIGSGMIADSRQNAAAWNSDQEFVSTIEARLPKGAMVYQLPFVPWPEGGTIGGVVDQDMWRGFLHSKDLKWSFAGMRGRQSDWQEYTSRQQPQALVDAVTAAGFDGLYIDRAAYSDPSYESGIKAALGGARPLVSPNGRLAFYDLRPHHDALVQHLGADGVSKLRADTLLRPRVEYRDGFAPRAQATLDIEHGARKNDTLLLENDASTPYPGLLTFNANSYSAREHQLNVVTPDGVSHTYTITPEATAISVPIIVPPGESKVKLTTDAPEVPVGYRDLSFNLTDAFVVRD